MHAAHHLNVQGLQGVAGRLDEVNAGVDAVVDNVAAVDLVLGLEVGVEALLNVLDNRAPRVVVVDKVTESRSIHDSQAEADAVLLDISAGRLDRHGLGDDVGIGAGGLLGRVEGGVKQGVDEGRLSQAGFTCRLVSFYQEASSALPGWNGKDNIPTTITLKLNPLRTLLRCHWLGRLANPT